MRKLFVMCLLLGACQPAKTPEQAIVELRFGLGSAAAGFNVYASQRPFCGDPEAKAPPFCADRHVVIQGDKAAHAVADAIDRAEFAVRALGAGDAQWAAIAEPATLLKGFQAFVAKATGE